MLALSSAMSLNVASQIEVKVSLLCVFTFSDTLIFNCAEIFIKINQYLNEI